MNPTVGTVIICVVAFLFFLYVIYTPKKAREAKLTEGYKRDNYEIILRKIANYQSRIERCDNLIRKRSEEIIENILAGLKRKSPEKVEKIFSHMEEIQTGVRKGWSLYYDIGMFTEVPVYGMAPVYKLVVKEEFRDEFNRKLCNLCASDEESIGLKKDIERYKKNIDYLEIQKLVYEAHLEKFRKEKETKK